MNELIRHRGPDSEGHLEGKGVALAMRRLSILDVAGGDQPVANETGDIRVVFNGEIYNYLELREDLVRKGHCFKTTGDTETLVHLYEEHGVDMLHRLRGMFSFALWDEGRRQLLLARDRLGKKPLHYAESAGDLTFCSEIDPLAGAGVADRAINAEGLGQYLAFGYIPAPHTIYRGIRKLPPAHYLLWKDGRTTIRRYWRLEFGEGLSCSRVEAREQLREKLDESIRLRLRSDVPVGLLLSGGLDSNAVLSRLARGFRHPVQTFTIGFSERRYDESEAAREAARHFGSEHHELRGESNLLRLLPKLVRHHGEPFADKSALPSFLVSQLTGQQVKVALNGDGGDEAFAGYGKYRLSGWRQLSNQLFPDTLARSLTLGSLMGKGLAGGKPARNFRRQFLPATESLFTSEFFTGSHFAGLVTRELRDATGSCFARLVDEFFEGDAGTVNRMLGWDYEHYLPGDLLVKMDIASMANSLEVRSPFLDHELVEFTARMPPAWKVDGRGGKLILRELVEPDLPPQVAQASKRGFSAPLQEWFRGPLREDLRESTHGLHPMLADHVVPAYARRMFDEHQSGRRNHAQRLWSLWMLNAWARENLP